MKINFGEKTSEILSKNSFEGTPAVDLPSGGFKAAVSLFAIEPASSNKK